MGTYFEFAKKSFMKNMVYRFNYIMGIVNLVIYILIYVAIWKAIYGTKTVIDGVSYKMVVTNFILGLGITNAFVMNEFMVAKKVRSGDISSELLKPIDFTKYVLAVNLGETCFKVVMNFIPAVIVCALFIGVLPPASVLMFILSLVSIVFGYLIMFYVSYMVSLISFWYFNIWSFATIKNVIIQILSGVIMPIWFMPKQLVAIIKLTPFDSIFYIPVSIYMGKLSASDIMFSMLKQAIWVFILYGLSKLIWSLGIKKLVVQGG